MESVKFVFGDIDEVVVKEGTFWIIGVKHKNFNIYINDTGLFNDEVFRRRGLTHDYDSGGFTGKLNKGVSANSFKTLLIQSNLNILSIKDVLPNEFEFKSEFSEQVFLDFKEYILSSKLLANSILQLNPFEQFSANYSHPSLKDLDERLNHSKLVIKSLLNDSFQEFSKTYSKTDLYNTYKVIRDILEDYFNDIRFSKNIPVILENSKLKTISTESSMEISGISFEELIYERKPSNEDSEDLDSFHDEISVEHLVLNHCTCKLISIKSALYVFELNYCNVIKIADERKMENVLIQNTNTEIQPLDIHNALIDFLFTSNSNIRPQVYRHIINTTGKYDFKIITLDEIKSAGFKDIENGLTLTNTTEGKFERYLNDINKSIPSRFKLITDDAIIYESALPFLIGDDYQKYGITDYKILYNLINLLKK